MMIMPAWAASALAEVSNIGLHFLHPLADYEHASSCALCASLDGVAPEARARAKRSAASLQAEALFAMPTPSDLDLVQTGSNAVRQLAVLGAPTLGQPALRAVERFARELATHLGYKLGFDLPVVDLRAPFHVLVVVACDGLEPAAVAWLRDAVSRCARRTVLICPESQAGVLLGGDAQDTRVSAIHFRDIERTMGVLLHSMLVTKHRLMPRDLLRYEASAAGERDAPFSMQAPQSGMCLFL